MVEKLKWKASSMKAQKFIYFYQNLYKFKNSKEKKCNKRMQYDFIFNGGGVAALSLAMYMNENLFFADKKILIIESQKKDKNDKTFSFWTTDESFFEKIVHKQWKKIAFLHPKFEKNIDIFPYVYKTIRAIDFYQYCQNNLKKNKNITFLSTKSHIYGSTPSCAWVQTDAGNFEAQWLFNSVPNAGSTKKIIKKKPYHYYLQHFKGWIIHTKKDVFDVETATFMDFRLPQKKGEASFMYLLPTSKNESLVEYTIFGQNIFTHEIYEAEIKNYIHNFLHLQENEYEIKETEFGVIPMFDEPFVQKESSFVMNIGAAGGATKASTGYTFQNIQKESQKIIASLMTNSTPFYANSWLEKRFSLYDSMLLEVMQSQQLNGADIFQMMFEKHLPTKIFRFLDNESNFLEELQIMASVPSFPFVKAFFNLVQKGYFFKK
ncbi:MAG: hypothetical protein EAZ20_07295 [Bacteroidetes bacterium]|nr:MAG: hypothetical protein EAZ20_07295 [Bacteroidota bacterium]